MDRRYDRKQQQEIQQEFAERRQRFNLVTNVLAAAILASIVLAIVLKPAHWKMTTGGLALILALAWLAVDFFYWRCPACGDRLGAKRYPRHCWNCGIELDQPSDRWGFGHRRFWRCQACGALATINRDPRYCWTCGIQLRAPER
jgi:rubrerythrin